MKTHFIVGTDRFVVLLFCCHGNQGAQKSPGIPQAAICDSSLPPVPLSDGDGEFMKGPHS